MKRGLSLAAAAATLALTRAQILKDFDKDFVDVPKVPNGDENIVVENMWMFGGADELGKPTSMRFLPAKGKKPPQVVTAHKTGMLALWDSIYSDVADYTLLLDIRPIVYSADDHGLLSVELHPDFADGTTELFLLYTGEPKDVFQLSNNEVVTPIRPDGSAGLYPGTTYPMPAWGTYPAPEGTGFEWRDFCINLDAQGVGQNEDGLICEHPYYVDRVVLDLSGRVAKAELANTVVLAACGDSSTHGPGNLIKVGNDLVFSQGDGSQWAYLDAGNPELSGCYDPTKDPLQGVFRSQQDAFSNGKIVRIPYGMLSTGETVDAVDLDFVAKGLRNPFRIFYDEEGDSIYVGDVGLGDTLAGTSERIFRKEGVTGANLNDASNFGWPCLEGLRARAFEADGSLGEFSVWDGFREVETMTYLDKMGSEQCAGVAQAAIDYAGEAAVPPEIIAMMPANAVADPLWAPPLFEYRGNKPRLLDADYPNECNADFAAVTSVFLYPNAAGGPEGIPAEYRGKLMFADYVKKCVWYFDDLEAQTPPHVLLSNTAVIDMQMGPDGYLYFIDYTDFKYTYIARMYDVAAAPDYLADWVPPATEEPVLLPLDPTDLPAAVEAQACPDPYSMPEIEWKIVDGEYYGELHMTASEIPLSYGYMRTRTFDGLVPGRIMRFNPCGVYHLTLYNDLEEWPLGREGFNNEVEMPTITNLHVHGMHVSGEFPGDSVATEVWPGEKFEYIYHVPCDHAGGIYWYHPHKHGSTSLQTNGGAAGFIVVNDNKRMGEHDMPEEYENMPEAFIHFHQFVPQKLMKNALLSRDYVFESDIEQEFYTVNGCERLDLNVNAGEWTKLRILHSGDDKNAVVEIAQPCRLLLLAKDGVNLSQMPRILEDNKMFFSLSSRVDAAVMCPAGAQADITVQRLGEDPVVYGAITAIGDGPNQPDLPPWQPCRPAYLQDLWNGPLADTLPVHGEIVEIRGGTINAEFYNGYDGFILSADVGTIQEWTSIGDFEHPVHLHVNHVQLGDVSGESNILNDAPNWNVFGDWIDSWSIPGVKKLRWRPDRFVGHAPFHCHIAEHSDQGMMIMVEIAGEGQDALGSTAILEYGTCPTTVDTKPYTGKPVTLPGTVQAELYDIGGQGLAFENLKRDGVPTPDFRAQESGPEAYRMSSAAVTAAGPTNVGGDYFVSSIFAGEWMTYSVDVEQAGEHRISLRLSGGNQPGGLQLRLYSNVDSCPSSNSANADKNLLADVFDGDFKGTAGIDDWTEYTVPFPTTMAKGKQTITVCFDSDTNLALDSFAVTLDSAGSGGSGGGKNGAGAKAGGLLGAIVAISCVSLAHFFH